MDWIEQWFGFAPDGGDGRVELLVMTGVGRLDDKDILRLNRAMLVFLGLAVSPRAGREG